VVPLGESHLAQIGQTGLGVVDAVRSLQVTQMLQLLLKVGGLLVQRGVV
jgi:hypothetical protein